MTRARSGVVVALGASTALAMAGDMLLYTALPLQHATLGIGVGAVGVLLSIHRVIRLVANPVGGFVYDRFGRRPPFLLGMAFAFASTLGYALADGFWSMLLARLVWGLAFALIWVGGVSIVLDAAPATERGRALGVFQSLVQVGTMGALVMSGVLADLIGYRSTAGVFAVVTAVGCLIAYGFVPETRPARAGQAAHASLRQAYRAVDRRLVWPAYASFAVFFAGNGVLMATLSVHVRADAAAAGMVAPLATIAGVLLASRKLAAIVSSPVAGFVSDRLGDRRWVAGMGVLAGVSGFAVLAAAQGLGAIATGVVLTALGEGIVLPPLTAWAGDLTPPSLRGVVMGGMATANDLGGAIGPLVGYAIGAAAGLRPAYALCAIILLSALAALAAAGPDPRHRPLVAALD